MTSAEQQALFEQTRTRIERNVAEISQLAQSSVDPKVFLPKFMHLAVGSLSAKGGALWLVRGDGSLERIAEHNFESLRFNEDPLQRKNIEKVLSDMQRTRRACVVAAADPSYAVSGGDPNYEPHNIVPHPVFYTPVIVGEHVSMVLQVWLADPGDPKTYNDISAFLTSWAAHGTVFLRNHQGAAAASRNEELQLFLRMQSSLLGEFNPKEVAAVLVNYATDILKADLTCLFRRKGKRWKLFAASNQEVVDERSQHVRTLLALVNNLPVEEDKSTLLSAKEERATEIRPLFEGAGLTHAVFRAFGDPNTNSRDFLLCAFKNEESGFAMNVTEMMDRVVVCGGKAMEAAFHHHCIPFRPVLSGAGKAVKAWKMGRRAKITVWSSVAALILFGFFIMPYPLKISADCMVRPDTSVVAVAETHGKIIEVLVREGQRVEQGQVLARLEDRDYTTQLAVAEQQRLRWQVEAARAQAAGMEADRRLSVLNMQREEEVIRRLQYLHERTEIVAPVEGVVLTKNLHNRVGEFLEIGRPFCEIGSPDQFELVLDIKQGDVGELLKALKNGDRLPVHFVLHSHSHMKLTADIESAIAIGQTPEVNEKGSFFQAVVSFPDDNTIQPFLKPGYTGKAKVEVGTTNFAHSLIRPFINFCRVEFGL